MQKCVTKSIARKEKKMEMPGIEPGASYMRSKRSTTELHPQCNSGSNFMSYFNAFTNSDTLNDSSNNS